MKTAGVKMVKLSRGSVQSLLAGGALGILKGSVVLELEKDPVTLTVKERITQALADAGIKVVDWPYDPAIASSVGSTTHKNGLPVHEVIVVPGRESYPGMEWSELRCVVVSAQYVTLCRMAQPYNFRSWYVVKQFSYSTPEEMVREVKGFCVKPEGCWSSDRR